MTKKARSSLVLVLLLLFSMAPAPAIADSGLVVGGSSIIRPDPTDQFDCTTSAIEVLRTDGRVFGHEDRIEITYRFPEVDPALRQIPMAGATKYTIPRDLLSPSRKKAAAVPYTLCTYNMPTPNLTKMELQVHHKNFGFGLGDVSTASIIVDILPRESSNLVVENLMDSCQINTSAPFFENNLLISQIAKPQKSGGRFAITGTLFRQGIAASKTVIEFREQKPGEYAKLGRLLGRAITDSKGQFKFSSSLKKYYGFSYTTVEAYVPDQILPIGPVAFANDEFAFDFDFQWSSGGTYTKGIFDWIPASNGQCRKAYTSYETAYSPNAGGDSHIWMYVAKRAFFGTKGKSARSVSEGFSSGKCFVSGYFRNGTWVNGYFRSC